MSDRKDPARLGRRVIANTVPAYVFPAIGASINAYLTGDERLLAAAPVTIAIPSAIAALLTTLALAGRTPDPARRRGWVTVVRAVLLAALVGAAATYPVGAALYLTGVTSIWVLAYAPSSAALGAAITAGTWARSGLRGRLPEAGLSQGRRRGLDDQGIATFAAAGVTR